jgi:hypothetical protein
VVHTLWEERPLLETKEDMQEPVAAALLQPPAPALPAQEAAIDLDVAAGAGHEQDEEEDAMPAARELTLTLFPRAQRTF